MVVYRGVQIITHYVLGVSVKCMKKKFGPAALHQKLGEVVKNFVQSERADNLQGVITATAQMCEHLYGMIMGFVDMAQFLYSDQLTNAQIQRYLTELPEHGTAGVDAQFIQIFNIIQQLTKVCMELLQILEAVHKASAGVRKATGFQLIDMDLEEEPLYSCMQELHKALKRLF